MLLSVNYLTENECYKVGAKIKPKGIVVHSVGVGQPNKDVFIKSWNTHRPFGRQVCVHAFLDDKGVTQTLPWDMRCWGCGSGKNGSYNNSHIQFEICEPAGNKYSGGQLIDYDAKKNEKFFNDCYNNAVDLCVMLCNKFSLTEKDIVCHSEAYKLGYASNHSDVMHWFPKHGKSMDTFRNDVKLKLNAVNNTIPKENKPVVGNTALYRVQAGAFGIKSNADAYALKLKAAGFNTYVVKVGSLYKVQTGAFSVKSNAEDLVRKLKAAGFDAFIV